MQSQKAVSAYFTIRQIHVLPFGFAEQCICLIDKRPNADGMIILSMIK